MLCKLTQITSLEGMVSVNMEITYLKIYSLYCAAILAAKPKLIFCEDLIKDGISGYLYPI